MEKYNNKAKSESARERGKFNLAETIQALQCHGNKTLKSKKGQINLVSMASFVQSVSPHCTRKGERERERRDTYMNKRLETETVDKIPQFLKRREERMFVLNLLHQYMNFSSRY
jgi:hypothetical protein